MSISFKRVGERKTKRIGGGMRVETQNEVMINHGTLLYDSFKEKIYFDSFTLSALLSYRRIFLLNSQVSTINEELHRNAVFENSLLEGKNF
jgi:hypothetical protein